MDSVDSAHGGVIFPAVRKRYIRRQSRIIATSSFLPERVVTNQEIIDAGRLPVADGAVRKSLGAERRRVAEPGLTDSDLLVEAARGCCERAGIPPDRLSRILVTKFLGDRILPMTAALVQRKLNCSVSMHALDIEGGINSFLAAIDLATRYISTTADDEQYILILSGGIHRIAVSATDPRLAFLFGDGAAAVLLGVSAETHFLASYAYTNYSLFDAAGTRMMKMDGEVSENLYARGKHHLLYDLYQMGNWKETLDFALEAACVTRDRLLEESGLSMDQMDLVLVTENNRRIRDLTLEALRVPQDRTATLFAEYGNTMSAMLPLLLDSVFREGRVRDKANIMLISHGEGASGGGLLYRA